MRVSAPISKGAPHHLNILKKILCYANGERYLDVSIGFGYIARVLRRLGYDVQGVDSSEISGLLMKRFEDTEIRIHDLRIEDERLPFPDNSFDVVYWGATIEHLHNSPKSPIDEMFRVVRGGD